MPGLNEGTKTGDDETLLASTDMKALLKVSPKGLAALDEDTGGAASRLKSLIQRAVTSHGKEVE